MRFRPYVPTALILLLLLSATAVATWVMLAGAADRARSQFDDQVAEFEMLVTDAMRSYQQVLRSGVAALNALPTMRRDQWRAFVKDMTADDFYPGIQGIGYSKRLQRSEIAAFVDQQHREGRPDYRFNPEGERDVYTAIVYLEPDDWRNRRTIGYDMFSEPRRRAAMEQAQDSGRPRLSQKVTLMQESGEDVQPGVLVFLPVYADGVTPDTVEARRKALQGYVYGAFRMKDFIERVLARNMPDAFSRLQVRIYDGLKVAESELLFDDRMLSRDATAPLPPLVYEPQFKDRRTISVAETPWTLVVGSKPALEATADRSMAWTVLFGGSLISFLIAGIFASLAYAGDRLARAERALMAEVAERKRAEERGQIANRELIHRVKNMLAIVTAIASQTARYTPTVTAFNKAFRERLTAMARVQDLLRPDPAHAPDLGTFARDILEPFCADRVNALTTDGPRVELTQQDAVLLSLLINELATNATKYGAWSVPAGRVALTWREFEEESEKFVELVWHESGGPPVQPPSSNGFGTNVMKFAIERGLRGRITTSFDPAGIRHEVRLPRTEPSAHDEADSFEGED